MDVNVGSPRRILLNVDKRTAAEDVDRYAKLAVEFGASDAKVIAPSMVVIDERARMKCKVPRCRFWGQAYYCSSEAPSPDEMRNILPKYEYAIFIRCDVHPVEDYADRARSREMARGYSRKLADIIGKIEALACHEGYYFAMGFGSGTCKSTFCLGQDCAVVSGYGCRFPLKARPSMEVTGMDAFKLAASVGWEIYPIGFDKVDPKDVPCATTLGLVLIC